MSPTGTTAADTTSMKRTMDITDTITAMMVTKNITAKANTPAPTLKTIMRAAADTQTSMDAMTITMGGAIAGQSMTDTTMGTSERRPTEMRQTTPPTEDNERCGIAVTTSDMATILEEKLKEKEKQLKLAKVAKRLDRLTKAVKHLAERTQVSPKIVEAMEHLTTEHEEMAGIIECPAAQQRTLTKLANNRFAALSEEEEVDHGNRPTMTDMYAANEVRDNKNMHSTNRHGANNQNRTVMYAANAARDNQNMRAANRYGASNQYSSMANETMMNNEDDMSVGTR